jgi:Protein of unknown function (DUF2877)
MNLRANSIGRRAEETLQPGVAGRVLASFSRICDFVTSEGSVVALAQSGSERGPWTILLEPNAAGDLSTHISPGTPFHAGVRELRLSGSESEQVRIDLSGAARWEPGLPWETLRLQGGRIRDRARITARVVAQESRAEAPPYWESHFRLATEKVLAAHDRRDRNALKTALRDLCGLGEGLTPAGDDWLAGWLLGLQLSEPTGAKGRETQWLGESVLEAAAGRTTLLSYAFLICAAAGEATESWHMLLSQMARHAGDKSEIEAATRRILAHGATSGAAMLKGFLAGLGTGQGSDTRLVRNGASN